jgi:large subunit ribosomal protein L4
LPNCDVFDLNKNKVGSVVIDPDIFESPVKEHLLHTVVRWQLANRRSGTASTKTRGEVSGGGRKPWKQKHLGRARQGSIRSPQWRKGAVVFGPRPRDWSYDIPKKVRRQALKSALSIKHRDGKLIIIREINLPEISTKSVVEFIKRFELDKTLILINDKNENLRRSARNLKSLKILSTEGVNVYDLLRFDFLVVTEDSLLRLREVFRS